MVSGCCFGAHGGGDSIPARKSIVTSGKAAEALRSVAVPRDSCLTASFTLSALPSAVTAALMRAMDSSPERIARYSGTAMLIAGSVKLNEQVGAGQRRVSLG